MVWLQAVPGSDVLSWLSPARTLLLCCQLSFFSAGEARSPDFQREPPSDCGESWFLTGFHSVIPSASCHQKSLISSALLTTPVLSSNVAVEFLLILIALWSFYGPLETL